MWPVHILPDEVYVNKNVYVVIQTEKVIPTLQVESLSLTTAADR